MRVLLAGGGSGGSSAPVLAVAEELTRRGAHEFLYVGTEAGPERQLVERMGIPFRAVMTGKLRRYWSAQNFADLSKVPVGLAQAVGIVRAFRPDVAFAAGGFGAVPPLLAARLAGVPIAVHQQDVEPGLANRILAPFAQVVTVTFPDSVAHFPRGKTRVTGNPVRPEILAGSRERGMETFGLAGILPVVLATGGGTGALGLNRIVAGSAALLEKECQIVHITGKGKSITPPRPVEGYRQLEFVSAGMGDLLAASDLVVSRAGLSTLTEISALGKGSILVPMPDSHQKANADVFGHAGAALVLQQGSLDPAALARAVRELLRDEARLAELGEKARTLMELGAEARIADEVLRVSRR